MIQSSWLLTIYPQREEVDHEFQITTCKCSGSHQKSPLNIAWSWGNPDTAAWRTIGWWVLEWIVVEREKRKKKSEGRCIRKVGGIYMTMTGKHRQKKIRRGNVIIPRAFPFRDQEFHTLGLGWPGHFWLCMETRSLFLSILLPLSSILPSRSFVTFVRATGSSWAFMRTPSSMAVFSTNADRRLLYHQVHWNAHTFEGRWMPFWPKNNANKDEASRHGCHDRLDFPLEKPRS